MKKSSTESDGESVKKLSNKVGGIYKNSNQVLRKTDAILNKNDQMQKETSELNKCSKQISNKVEKIQNNSTHISDQIDVLVNRKEKITIKNVVLCIISLILTAALPIVFSLEYNFLFCHPVELGQLSVKLTGDANRIGPGEFAAKVFKIDNYGNVSIGYDSDDAWNCYAPKLRLDLQYKGTVKAVYLFYKDDLHSDFIMQKAANPKTRTFNNSKSFYSSDIVLNYSLHGGMEQERIYIMIVDSDNNPSIYCALIDRYDPQDISSERDLEVKSSEQIYELTPYRQNDYWLLHKIDIIVEISELLKMRSNIDYSNFG